MEGVGPLQGRITCGISNQPGRLILHDLFFSIPGSPALTVLADCRMQVWSTSTPVSVAGIPPSLNTDEDRSGFSFPWKMFNGCRGQNF
jgi:hypothetical protein